MATPFPKRGLLPFDNPVSQFVDPRRNALMGFSAGMLSGDPGAAMTGAMRGGALDQQYAQDQLQFEQDQQAKNSTLEWLKQNGYGDLVAGVEGGGLDMGTAWSEALKRSQPGYGQQAPIKVGAGETLLDPATMQPIYQGAPDMKDQFGYEKDLAAQYGGQDPVKTYQAVRNGYERVRASAQQANGAGDISMIFAYMKMLDPTSVVREGEFATAENAGGVGATVSNLYNKLLEGQRLTPELRRQFLQQADGLYQESAANLSDLNRQYNTRADAWGVDPTRFVVPPENYQPIQLNTGWNDVGGGYRIREK